MHKRPTYTKVAIALMVIAWGPADAQQANPPAAAPHSPLGGPRMAVTEWYSFGPSGPAITQIPSAEEETLREMAESENITVFARRRIPRFGEAPGTRRDDPRNLQAAQPLVPIAGEGCAHGLVCNDPGARTLDDRLGIH